MRMVSHGNLCRGGRQGEGGFTIKMSEHPSIHPFSVVSLPLVLYVLPGASGISSTPARSSTEQEFDIPQSTLNEWLFQERQTISQTEGGREGGESGGKGKKSFPPADAISLPSFLSFGNHLRMTSSVRRIIDPLSRIQHLPPVWPSYVHM